MTMPMDLGKYPVTVRIEIAWSDLDALGMVNNVLFYRYFERARFEYYARLGMAPGSASGGIGPVMAYSSCRYLASLTYPEAVTVGARIREMGMTSLVMEFVIVGDRAGKAALGETVIVMTEYATGAKVPLPGALREAVRTIEGGRVKERDGGE